jgi:hypothetical protein
MICMLALTPHYSLSLPNPGFFDFARLWRRVLTSGRFMGIAMLLALAPAGIAVALSGKPAEIYTKALHPGLLVLGGTLAVWTGAMYRKDLRRAFWCLAVFLYSYGLLNISPFIQVLQSVLGEPSLPPMLNFLTVLLCWQVATYLVLFVACLSILRAVGVKRLKVWGLLISGAAAVLGLFIIYTGFEDFNLFYQVSKQYAVSLLLIRIFDMLVFVMLVPVLMLYLQGARSKYQESSTFMVVVVGIIASLVAVYIYELVRAESLVRISAEEFEKGSFLDGLYIYAYLLIGIGLMAHRKHQEWSMSKIEDELVLVGDGASKG